jgi:hypothetical protein
MTRFAKKSLAISPERQQGMFTASAPDSKEAMLMPSDEAIGATTALEQLGRGSLRAPAQGCWKRRRRALSVERLEDRMAPATFQGIGGGLYLAAGGSVCIDAATIFAHNHASTSNDDVFGSFVSCP